MASTPGQPQLLVDDGSSNLLLEVGRTIRDNAHTLFGMSLLLMAAALPWLMLGTVAAWWMAWTPLVLATAPVWIAICAGADRLLDGEAVPLRALPGLIRCHAGAGLRIGIVPAFAGAALIGTVALLEAKPDARWLAALLLLQLGVAVAVAVLLAPAFPLAVRYGLTGLDLWQASALLARERPAQVLGAVTLAGSTLWLTLALGPAMLLILAPLAMLIVAVTRPDPA